MFSASVVRLNFSMCVLNIEFFSALGTTCTGYFYGPIVCPA
ncbi:hypothetical protein yaldo0001_26520 [Yersinia aldovae ATCC 35236]|nr:hypothetical protein yaldo0001_26520 [Yersinia aldovae ATCC 35236]